MIMRTFFYKIVSVCFAFLVSFGVNAQTAEKVDSVVSESDSLVHVLRNQVQELQLQRIMMQEQLAETGRSDSARKAERMARIDSLRTITPGAPLVIDGDTLLVLYARKGGVLAEKRVEQAYNNILSQGKRMTMFADSVYVYESDFFSDIMAGNDVILSVTDLDGLWQNTTRQELAAQYAEVIKTKIVEIHEEYGLRQKLYGLMWVAIIIVVQTLLIRFTLWLYRRWRYRLLRLVMRRDIPLRIRDYEVLNVRRRGLLFLFFYLILFHFQLLLRFLCLIRNPLHLLQARAFVDDDGLEIGEGLVDHILERSVRRKGHLCVSRYDDAFTGVDIDALTFKHFNEFERAEAFNLNQFVGGYVLNNRIEEFAKECFGVFLRQVLHLGQYLGQLRKVYLGVHDS